MNDGFQSVFNVELLPRHVWESVYQPATTQGECLVPGFPSADRDETGCRATILAIDRERLLRCRKADDPCAGTEIEIRIEPANAAGWPTRVALAQSGFGDPAPRRDTFDALWRQIVADFRLFLERGVVAPHARPTADFGATTQHAPIGLEITAVAEAGLADRCGLRAGDVLLTLADIRVYDTAQLWAVLAAVAMTGATDTDAEIVVTAVRDRGLVTGQARI